MLYFILGFLSAVFIFLLVTTFYMIKKLKEAETNIVRIIDTVNLHTNSINNINNIINKQNPEFFIK